VIGNKSLPYSLPQPLRREGSASSQVFCRKLSDKEPVLIPRVRIGTPPPSGRLGGVFTPLLSEGPGEASVYLSVKQIVTKVFAELVTPVPQKTIAF